MNIDWIRLVMSVPIALAIAHLLSITTFARIQVINQRQLPLYQQAARQIGCRMSVHHTYVGLANIPLKPNQVCIRYPHRYLLEMERLVRSIEADKRKKLVQSRHQTPNVYYHRSLLTPLEQLELYKMDGKRRELKRRYWLPNE